MSVNSCEITFSNTGQGVLHIRDEPLSQVALSDLGFGEALKIQCR